MIMDESRSKQIQQNIIKAKLNIIHNGPVA